ncbi:DUF2071 domain-containing protein [Streptantibioticus rubrisoli]|uniref:DUF2071 domain-containing protein n=1 Tax=Streptantibioticus rubrisoli TaxID=1387313 RepID=A0ABT1P9S3_9ACTN|nr:DUF2071 domain-containing protein [Streptantibioticus rubrisoli]MCQ4042104.1 DUF2071 domain-containing protein [Streptantibioticus rubrisoli]
MKHLLRRHPIPLRTHFAHSLVLTYAFPADVLRPLLTPGLELDTYTAGGQEYGFAAVALVDLRALRPPFAPRVLGTDQLMTGYRVFTRLRTPGGRTMRGLRILRSDTSSRVLALGGNVLTRYHYQLARLGCRLTDDRLEFAVRTRDASADLLVAADLRGAAALPEGSPFATERDARRFAGPLPYTFEYEPRDDSVTVVKAYRTHWAPRQVAVDVRRLTFFEHGAFAGTRPLLANAFHVAGVDYGWHAGVRHRTDGSRI